MSAAGGAATYVEDVFSEDLYVGNSSGTTGTTTITNGVDLSGEGGMVYFLPRTQTAHKAIIDTVRGGTKELISTSSTTENNAASGTGITFNSDGFSATGSYLYNSNINTSGQEYAALSFRKCPNFFDVIEYTGNGSGQTISHNLGVVPGMIWVKARDRAEPWMVFHRRINGQTNYNESYKVELQSSAQAALTTAWGNYNSSTGNYGTHPTATEFTVGGDSTTNQSGYKYMAYLFAHHDGTGTFGDTGDQDIISCGYYDGNNSVNGPKITLNWEPQFIFVKRVTGGSGNFHAYDSWRILGHKSAEIIQLNQSNAAIDYGPAGPYHFQPDGFQNTYYDTQENAAGSRYIYFAIRRPMKPPTSASDVFANDYAGQSSTNAPYFTSGFPLDMGIHHFRNSYDNKIFTARPISKYYLRTNTTNTETSLSGAVFDYGDGYFNITSGVDTSTFASMWKKAPHFFDVQYYKGTGSATGHKHSLGVAPEMMWIKNLDNGYDWICYHKDLGNSTYSAQQSFLKLNSNAAMDFDTTAYWNNTAPTSTHFYVDSSSTVNRGSNNFVWCGFASLSGVSKIGIYTGNNTSQNIDCGFSNGAAFVMIKRVSDTGDWLVFDTLRGINSGADPMISWNNTDPETSSYDSVDPYSSGFTVQADTGANYVNSSGEKYIFYAIAA